MLGAIYSPPLSLRHAPEFSSASAISPDSATKLLPRDEVAEALTSRASVSGLISTFSQFRV